MMIYNQLLKFTTSKDYNTKNNKNKIKQLNLNITIYL